MAPYINGTAPSNSQIPPDQDIKPSGIRVIIVGAGFAGITAAIECTRKGHSCIILESYKSTNVQLGDVSPLAPTQAEFSSGGQVYLRSWTLSAIKASA